MKHKKYWNGEEKKLETKTLSPNWISILMSLSMSTNSHRYLSLSSGGTSAMCSQASRPTYYSDIKHYDMSHYLDYSFKSGQLRKGFCCFNQQPSVKNQVANWLLLVKNITKGRVCFWIWLWLWFGVDAFMCDKEEEDCYEHPHDGNWSGKRPEGPGVLDCIKG